MAPAILFYDVVLSVHVMAIVLAFGVTFAYPILFPYLQRAHPEALAAAHEAQGRIGKFLITPAATVALAAGAYLASDRHYWNESWVTVPLVILVVILGLAGAFFAPTERRAAEVAARDVAASAGGPVKLSDEYHALARRIAIVGFITSTSVLVAVFFMVAKPGGY
jgi:uncharacterized membrane protein